MAFIEGPESLRLQFQRAGHVQRVQGADAESRSILPRKINAPRKGSNGKVHLMPNACCTISIKDRKRILGFIESRFFPKNVKKNRIGDFGPVKGSQPNRRVQGHSTPSFLRMSVKQIKGDEKAAVCVGRQ